MAVTACGTADGSWQRGWRGEASHLYVQHGRGGRDGLAGGHDEQGHDLEPRSLAVEFVARDPKLRDVRDFANPDPRPKADSPALPDDREGYIGAFGREENWLEEWTVFGPESPYDLRQLDEEGN